MNDRSKRQTGTCPRRPAGRRQGFTLIELLVVMIVISLLAMIAVPAALKLQLLIRLNACQNTVNQIDAAVQMYRDAQGHRSYPETHDLVARLIGYELQGEAASRTEIDDGKKGFGYRLQHRGRVYGPWYGLEKVPRSDDPVKGSQARTHFLDSFGNYIWYCRAEVPEGGGQPTYTDTDFTKDSSEVHGSVEVKVNNIADYAQTSSGAYYRTNYILMSPGADGKWGLARGNGSGAPPTDDPPPTDDRTNFFVE